MPVQKRVDAVKKAEDPDASPLLVVECRACRRSPSAGGASLRREVTPMADIDTVLQILFAAAAAATVSGFALEVWRELKHKDGKGKK